VPSLDQMLRIAVNLWTICTAKLVDLSRVKFSYIAPWQWFEKLMNLKMQVLEKLRLRFCVFPKTLYKCFFAVFFSELLWYSSFVRHALAGTENAGQELQDWKMKNKSAGLEIAGLEIDGQLLQVVENEGHTNEVHVLLMPVHVHHDPYTFVMRFSRTST